MDDEGKAKLTWPFWQHLVLDHRYDSNTYTVTGPSGEIFNHIYNPAPLNAHHHWYEGRHYAHTTITSHVDGNPDFCNYASDFMFMTFYVFEAGEYCIHIDDGCGNLVDYCITVLNCSEPLNFKSNNYFVYPSERDHSELGEGYENISNAFIANGGDCNLGERRPGM